MIEQTQNRISKEEYIINSVFKHYNFDNYQKEYKDTIIFALTSAINSLSDSLISVILGGSAGKNQIVENWSDIDLYIIIRDYEIKKISDFYNEICDSNIHIGVTFYTLQEIQKKIIDNKTKVMFYEKNQFKFNPTIYGENIIYEVDYSEIKLSDSRNIANVLHELRRMHILLEVNKTSVDKKYIKKMLVLMKCFLNSYGIFSYGYEKVFNDFKKLIHSGEFNDERILTVIDNFDIIYALKELPLQQKRIVEIGREIISFVTKNLKESGINGKKSKC